MNENEILKSIELLKNLVEDGGKLAAIPEEQRIELMKAAGQLTRPDRKEKKKRNREKNKSYKKVIVDHDRKKRANTGIRTARDMNIFTAPAQLPGECEETKYEEIKSPRNCYVCKAKFTKLHHFYDQMCPECAELNYAKRFQRADLTGQVAVITGSRLKIGYQATLMMLESGATVIATTRFPADSAIRFAKEPNFDKWGHRLQIYGLDLRHTPSVELFCNYIEEKYDRLDILINNAAQTVRRPPAFYSHLMENELNHNNLPSRAMSLLTEYHQCTGQLDEFNASHQVDNLAMPVSWSDKTPGIGISKSAELSQIPYTHDNTLDTEELFPEAKLDADLQQVDLRTNNSWRLRLGEISTAEMLELQLVNSVAPFVLCNRLSNLMKKDYTGCKHIINVSAMEGKFLKFKKLDRHPHTNMAKAALNMLTHTSSEGLKEYGIYMNAVDTGWVTDEDPIQLAKYKQEVHDFQPPLDIVDGAARVMDPLLEGINTGKHWCGKFLKDYFPIDW